MQRYLTAVVLAIAAVLMPPRLGATATSGYEQQVVDLVNQERANRGLPPLVIHDILMNAAEAHSVDMADHDFFAHDSSDGTDFGTRIRQFGYTPIYGLAENIAAGYVTPEQVVSGWMSSNSHRDHILGGFEHVGVGYYYANSQYAHYWTLDFGKPAPSTPPPTACQLAHDFDASGVIDAGDVEIMSTCWGDGVYDPAYDVNTDQTINIIDVMTISTEWGTTCQ